MNDDDHTERREDDAWVATWDGDARLLLPHTDKLFHHPRLAERLFSDKQAAFAAGFTVGYTNRDIELRGIDAVQADEDASHAEFLRLIEEIRAESDLAKEG